jgi:hypothetical protein
MKKIFLISIAVTFLFSCTNDKKEPAGLKNTKVSLRTDTLNVVKLTDTLVIYESTCRGCAYEASTSFEIKDSSDIIKLQAIITTDNSPANMAGGSTSKDIILVPVKTGATTIKLFKYWGPETKAKDSTRYTSYSIDVRN